MLIFSKRNQRQVSTWQNRTSYSRQTVKPVYTGLLRALCIPTHSNQTCLGVLKNGLNVLGFHRCPNTHAGITLQSLPDKKRLYEQGASLRCIGKPLVLWLGLVGLGNLLTTPVALAGDDVKRYGHVADLSENSTHYANYLLGSKSVLSSRPAQSEILIREPEPPKPPAPKLAPPERPEPAPYKETTTVQIKPLPQPEIGNGPIITRRSPPLFRDPLQMGGEGPEMAIVPAGTFSMGDVLGSGQRDEQPVHEVSMKRFAMSVYEVTFFEYDLFAEATGRQKPNDKGWGRGNRPVINVSWEDAVAYAKWLSQQTDLQYHLPTEAQWEYAARAGAQTEYSWGNDIGRNRANCAVCGSKWSNKQTAPVGSFPANPFGLYDMVANVYEWTCSANDKRYRRKKEQRCSCKESARYYCVYRGGSWRSLPKYARAANRSRGKKSYRNNNLGFRVAREIRE